MRTLVGRGTGTRLMLIAVMATALAACAGSSAGTAGPADAYGGATTGNPVSGGAFPAGSAAPSAAALAPADKGVQSGSGPAAVDNNLQVVYTGSLQLVVADVAQALARAKTAVAAAGGYIGSSQESNTDAQPTATITYRIPASAWEDTIAAIRATATKVVDEQTQASEVGGQIVDLVARIANLRASEAALQDIAKSTAKVSDLLEVQAQLTDVRGQIEQLDAQRARLVDQVSYGTLVTTFGMGAEQVKTAARGWDPATDVDGATAAILSFGQRVVSAAIWFVIVGVPILIVTLLVLFVAWRIAKRVAPRFVTPPKGPPASWGGETPPEP